MVLLLLLLLWLQCCAACPRCAAMLCCWSRLGCSLHSQCRRRRRRNFRSVPACARKSPGACRSLPSACACRAPLPPFARPWRYCTLTHVSCLPLLSTTHTPPMAAGPHCGLSHRPSPSRPARLPGAQLRLRCCVAHRSPQGSLAGGLARLGLLRLLLGNHLQQPMRPREAGKTVSITVPQRRRSLPFPVPGLHLPAKAWHRRQLFLLTMPPPAAARTHLQGGARHGAGGGLGHVAPLLAGHLRLKVLQPAGQGEQGQERGRASAGRVGRARRRGTRRGRARWGCCNWRCARLQCAATTAAALAMVTRGHRW